MWLKESDFDLSKFTVVGSPLISEDGIASGFSKTSYLQTMQLDTSKLFKIITPFIWKKPSSSFSSILAISSTYIDYTKEGTGCRMWLNLSTSGIVHDSQWFTPLIEGNKYFSVFSWDGSTYTHKTLDINGILIATNTYSSSEPIVSNYLRLGYIYNPCAGSIDLKQFSVSVDGKEVFSGNPTALDTIKANNYTVTGSPTITDDGVFKANVAGDYIQKTGFTNKIKKELRCDGRFYYSTKTSNTGNVINLANGSVTSWNINGDGLITLSDGTNTSTVQIEIPLKDGDIFDTEIIYNASTVTLNVCLNEGVNYTASIASRGLTTFNSWRLSVNENYWGGKVDLNTIHVYIDGNLVYQPCLKIPYTKAKTGSKIVDAAYRLRVEDCYNQYGAGNYYLFSSATEQFALPMPDIYGLIENLKLNITAIEENLKLDITAIEGADW